MLGGKDATVIAYKAHREDGKIPKVALENSKGEGIESGNFFELLDFLLARSIEEGEFHATWNLDGFAACVLSVLPKDKVADLLTYSELRKPATVITEAQEAQRKELRAKIREWLLPYDIEFVSEHRFKVTKGGYRCTLYNLSQFYSDDIPEPDVKETARLGQGIIDELKSQRIPIEPYSLSSAGSLITPLLRKANPCTWRDVPSHINAAFRETTRKPWISTYQLGYFKEPIIAYDYDIVAAYTSALAELLDVSPQFGDWIDSKLPPKGAKYGVAYGRIKITTPISPIIFVRRQDRINPAGSWSDWITLREIECIEEHKLGSFEPEEGHWFVPKRLCKPLHFLVWYFYKLRVNPLLGLTSKRMANACWGQQIAEYSTLGEFNCPVWGSVTETAIRCQCADFIFKNQLEPNLISVNVDGVLSTKQVSLKSTVYERPGDWKLTGSGEALAISSGLVWHGKAKPNGISLSQALAAVQAKPKAQSWQIDSTRPASPTDLVHFKTFETARRIKLGFGLPLPSNADRVFRPAPANGLDLLTRTFTSTAIETHE